MTLTNFPRGEWGVLSWCMGGDLSVGGWQEAATLGLVVNHSLSSTDHAH